MALDFRRRTDPEQPEENVRGAVEQPYHRRHHAGESLQGRCDDLAHRLRFDESQRLRSELAEDDVQESDDEERHTDCRGGVRTRRRCGETEDAEQPVDQYSESGLANPAEREGCDRDPELRSRDVAVQMLEGALDILRGAIACGSHLVDAAAANRNQGELGRDEKGVEADQEENYPQAGRDRPASYVLGRTLLKGKKVIVVLCMIEVGRNYTT